MCPGSEFLKTLTVPEGRAVDAVQLILGAFFLLQAPILWYVGDHAVLQTAVGVAWGL